MLVVTPDAWLPRGEAVAYGDGQDLVIWSGIPGERALVHVYPGGTRQLQARVLEPAGRPSPFRRAPPCEKYDACGGCPLMHLSPEGQVKARLWLIRDALRAEGLEHLAPRAITPSPAGDLGFKHAVRLAFGRSDQGHLRAGVYGRGSKRIVPIPLCPLVAEPVREAMKTVAHHVRELDIPPWDPQSQRGLLRYALIRASRGGEVLVTLLAGRASGVLSELASRLMGGMQAITGVHAHFNDGPGAELFLRDGDGTGPTSPIEGRADIEERLGELRLRVGPADVFPAHPAMAELHHAEIVGAFAEDPGRPALDLACGTGALTLALARAQGWAFGLDPVEALVVRARENAALNRIDAEFAAGGPEALGELRRRLAGRAPVVVADGGRGALEPAMAREILALKPARIVLRASNPRTMAQDLARFAARGYSAETLRAFDMYPQTAHLELVARLSPAEAPEPAGRAPRRKRVG